MSVVEDLLFVLPSVFPPSSFDVLCGLCFEIVTFLGTFKDLAEMKHILFVLIVASPIPVLF